MKNRILKLMNNEKLSATRFADKIGVQRSSISHIISGRNKPSFDFISKVIDKFPNVDAEWLINGKGNMYKDVYYDNGKENNEPELFNNTAKTAVADDKIKYVKGNKIKDRDGNKKEEEFIVKDRVTNVNKIEKLVILFSNGTFKEYSLSEK